MDWLYADIAWLRARFDSVWSPAHAANRSRAISATIGSGSIGATNVLRTGSKGLAAATLLLDAAKGFARCGWLRAGCRICEGCRRVAAVVGHCFPVWLKFSGGKGFATAAGVCLA